MNVKNKNGKFFRKTVFQRGHSTIQNISYTTTDRNISFCKSKSVVALFVDIERQCDDGNLQNDWQRNDWNRNRIEMKIKDEILVKF